VSTAVILNSRQGLRPCGSEPWIRSTVRAVQYASQQSLTLSVSVGTKPWELALFLAGCDRIPIKLYYPAGFDDSSLQNLIQQYKITDSGIDFIPVESGKSGEKSREFQKNRDQAIINDADILIPVSIKTGGNLDRLLIDSVKNGKSNVGDFRVPYLSSKADAKIEIARNRINPVLDSIFDNHLIHWTRTSNYRWPDETAADYYCDIVLSGNKYPRSALETLCNILSKKWLYASSRHYRKGYSAVAFSEMKPSQAALLMKWRARYREMTFEPYGIAIPIDIAEKTGLRRVIYGEAEVYHLLKPSDRPYFQTVGQKGFWLPEREWRCLGDLDLSSIPETKLAAIVMENSEIEKLSAVFPGPVYSFYSQQNNEK